MTTTRQSTGPTLLDALSLAAKEADQLLLATTQATHTAISRRVHGLVRLGAGPAVAPVEMAHDAIAGGVYAGIGLGLRGASKALDRAAETGIGPRLEQEAWGRFLSAAVNGLIGDELLRDRPQMAIPMAVRHEGRDVDVHDTAAVAEAFPAATGRVVVFLHGLCEDEAAWRIHRDRVGTTYPEALAADGWTPVLLRANTGLGLRENGAALTALLQRLTESWPVPVERIVLVGHSMGGLIMRAASAVQAEAGGTAWSDLVSDVVTLSTPHLGSWFAIGADHASRGLARLPEVAAFGRIIDRQGQGIRDLILGLAEDVPPLPHARYRLVSATLTRSERHPVARVIGDLLVTPRSAFGRDRGGRELFPDAEVLHVGRADHFAVLNHPDVHDALRRWLA
ncbi:MAG: GPI inositol-deacylase [Nocardioidaceae bacterium]|nr:GPI inositol-deacylase [Nocardioidaceae bacterium]MCL2614077.1 GPI inositol-deacylase [Nocardioidaceae bacterium]